MEKYTFTTEYMANLFLSELETDGYKVNMGREGNYYIVYVEEENENKD